MVDDPSEPSESCPPQENPWTINLRSLKVALDKYRAEGRLSSEKDASSLLWLHQFGFSNRQTIAQVADLLKYDKNTVYKVLKGLHEARLDKFVAAVDEFRARTENDNVNGLPFVQTTLARRIAALCERAIVYGKIVFIYGCSHCGKTTSLKQYKAEKKFGEVVCVRMPAGGHLGAFKRRLASALLIAGKRSGYELDEEIFTALKKVRLLIVDEVAECFPLDRPPRLNTLGYMFGRGVPPPSNTFRWCTSQIKIEPMLAALKRIKADRPGKFLMITGVRLGESAQRDARIGISCSKDGAECGQGWFQVATPEAVADTLAPILHWRVCLVWKWLRDYATEWCGFPTAAIADAYGGDEAEEINARTGCVGCNLASRDTALESILKNPKWLYLEPLMRLRPLYAELKKPHNRLRKDGSEKKKDGTLVANPMRLGPLTMEARRWGLQQVQQIEHDVNFRADDEDKPTIDLINREEYLRIIELIEANTWPDRWDGDEVRGDVILNEVMRDGSVQPDFFAEAL